MDEHLELITRFLSLRPGMIVVCKPCPRGCRPHRGILLSPNTEPTFDGDNVQLEPEQLVYPVFPRPDCIDREVAVISERSVEAGKVFRVVDDLDQMDSEQLWRDLNATKRRPETVR